MNLDTYWIRRALIAAGLMTALLLSGAALLRAEDDCQKRVSKADHKLHEAIEHHGWQSSQADHWRHELAEARNYCWDRDQCWWDADANRWYTDRDWDDHDHDHH
jgi:hypothetical protein